MAKPDKRAEAERLYTSESMPCTAIAAELGIDQGTVYRWKADAAAKGGAFNWDTQRKMYKTSRKEFIAIGTKGVKAMVIELLKDPKKFLCPKSADALSKYMSIFEKLDNTERYLEVATDLIEVINDWLTKNDPEIKTKMEPHWDSIFEALKEYLTKKGIF